LPTTPASSDPVGLLGDAQLPRLDATTLDAAALRALYDVYRNADQLLTDDKPVDVE
jgi:hypothetical protein